MSRKVRIRGQWKSDEEIGEAARMKKVRQAKVKIFRFDPSKDEGPRHGTYSVPLVENMSVLGVLSYIYEKIDSSLAFYFSCRDGKCGGCTVLINGKPVLACNTLASENMTIEPLPKRKIIRDLVVELK